MTRTSEIQDLYNFNRWANTRMLGALAALTPTQFAQDMKSSHPSIRDTVLHTMSSEWVWLMRWQGTSPTAMPEAWQSYALADIEQEWAAIVAVQQTFIGSLSESELDRIVHYRNLRGEAHDNPLWQLLRHMVNHSSYHRGQVTTMIRQLGCEPVATDLVLYYRLQSAAQLKP